MLIEFSVANYRSFKDEVTLSMVAGPIVAKDKRLDENNVLTVDERLRLLASAAIYGANASGKSNLIRALRFMKEFVLGSSKDTQALEPIAVEPFRLDPETTNLPSRFEIVFIAEGRQYRYGFEATTTRVTSEWLYHRPRTKETPLFRRDLDHFKLSGQFPEGRGLEGRTRPNALFLSVIAQFNGEISSRVGKWFHGVNVVSGLSDQAVMGVTITAFGDAERRAEIIRFVRDWDVGIDDLSVDSVAATPEVLPSSMPDALKSLILSVPGTTQVSVSTVHPMFDQSGRRAGLESFNLMEQESEGTKKLFAFAGPFLDTLKNGRILVVDELDARLHPLITRAIIGLFHSKRANPRRAQLIFATHDTNLLSNKLFRRDQIWFTEKDRYGASHLVSLLEYKVRNDASFESDYIHGKYGAIPYLGDLSGLLDDGRDDEARPA